MPSKFSRHTIFHDKAYWRFVTGQAKPNWAIVPCVTGEEYVEMMDWIDEKTIGRWTSRPKGNKKQSFGFEHLCEAIHFKLRFG